MGRYVFHKLNLSGPGLSMPLSYTSPSCIQDEGILFCKGQRIFGRSFKMEFQFAVRMEEASVFVQSALIFFQSISFAERPLDSMRIFQTFPGDTGNITGHAFGAFLHQFEAGSRGLPAI